MNEYSVYYEISTKIKTLKIPGALVENYPLILCIFQSNVLKNLE